MDIYGVLNNEVSQTSDILLYFLVAIFSPTNSKNHLKWDFYFWNIRCKYLGRIYVYSTQNTFGNSAEMLLQCHLLKSSWDYKVFGKLILARLSVNSWSVLVCFFSVVYALQYHSTKSVDPVQGKLWTPHLPILVSVWCHWKVRPNCFKQEDASMFRV